MKIKNKTTLIIKFEKINLRKYEKYSLNKQTH